MLKDMHPGTVIVDVAVITVVLIVLHMRMVVNAAGGEEYCYHQEPALLPHYPRHRRGEAHACVDLHTSG